MSAASVISHQISTFMSCFNFPIHFEDLVHQVPRLTNVMVHVLRSSLSQKDTTSVSRGLFGFKCQGENLFQIHHPSLLVHRHHCYLSFVRLPWSTSAMLLNSLTLHLEWYWIPSTLSKRNLSSDAHCAAAPTSLSSQLHDMGAGSRPGHLPQPRSTGVGRQPAVVKRFMRHLSEFLGML